MADQDQDARAAVIAALTTEHFVLQSAASATVNDAGARSSLYVLSLSSALVALGFASRSRDLFVPFVSTLLPSIFVLGIFTTVRLVDSALENQRCLREIARIRGFYRTLSPDAAIYFASGHGRWPETSAESLRLGTALAFLTTSASMIAFINSIVVGASIMWIAGDRLASGPALPFALGVIAATALMGLFLIYQRWRFKLHAEERPKPHDAAA
jgi:hypothetical protein